MLPTHDNAVGYQTDSTHTHKIKWILYRCYEIYIVKVGHMGKLFVSAKMLNFYNPVVSRLDKYLGNPGYYFQKTV